MNTIHKICLTFTIIGAIVWLIIGLFNFNIVEWIFGETILTNLIYIIVGVCGIINMGLFMKDLD